MEVLPLAGGVGQPDMLLEECVCVCMGGVSLWGYKAGPATDGVEVRLKVCACMYVHVYNECVCVRASE